MNTTIQHCEACLTLIYYETNLSDWKLEKECFNEFYREFSHPDLGSKIILEDEQGRMHVLTIAEYQNRIK